MKKLISLISKEWSTIQISGYLSKHEDIDISHETIYRWIRQDKKEGGNLYTHCRHKLKHRKRPVGASAKNIPNQRDISQRPKEAEGADLETLKWIQ